jgi:hypothetical protein
MFHYKQFFMFKNWRFLGVCIVSASIFTACNLVPNATEVSTVEKVQNTANVQINDKPTLEDLKSVGRLVDVPVGHVLVGEVLNYRKAYLLYPFDGGIPMEVYDGGELMYGTGTKNFSLESGNVIKCSGKGTSCAVRVTAEGDVTISVF